jgi:DNA-binding IclR family transcriptional regulator
MEPTDPSRRVRSVEKAFKIISYIQQRGQTDVSTISAELDLPKSTVHNYVTTLESMGYAVSENGSHRLGLRFLTHGMAARTVSSKHFNPESILESVADKISYPVWWLTGEAGRAIFVYESCNKQDSEPVYGQIGRRTDLHAHAPGKAILSQLSDEKIRRVAERHGLPKHTDQTVTDIESLLADIRQIRDRGFAVNENETRLDIGSVGAGFRDQANQIHALGVFYDVRQQTDLQQERLGETLANRVTSLEPEIQEEG